MSAKISYNGHELPDYEPPAYGYTPVVIHNGVAYVSGHVPKTGKSDLYPGKVGADVTVEQAQEAAKLALLNALSTMNHTLTNLDRVVRVLKITVFVASAKGFSQQPKVADAATNLLLEIFGDRGRHSRSAVGVAELPRNSSVEIELIVAVD